MSEEAKWEYQGFWPGETLVTVNGRAVRHHLKLGRKCAIHFFDGDCPSLDSLQDDAQAGREAKEKIASLTQEELELRVAALDAEVVALRDCLSNQDKLMSKKDEGIELLKEALASICHFRGEPTTPVEQPKPEPERRCENCGKRGLALVKTLMGAVCSGCQVDRIVLNARLMKLEGLEE